MRKLSTTREKNMQSSLGVMAKKLDSLEKKKLKKTLEMQEEIDEMKSRIAEKEIELNLQKKVNSEIKENGLLVRTSLPIPPIGSILKRKRPIPSHEEFLGITKRNDSSEECDYGVIYFCFKGFNVPEYLMEEMFEVENGEYKIVSETESKDLISIIKKYTRSRILRTLRAPSAQR